ncbi:hypothetical protein A2W24_01800 [Microgenomates group bacterium RBG_16_45_19]|nr:MAG: hypothetical protein A2W24_01800 [Microgenomates group bacterium RBG_16_45_19]
MRKAIILFVGAMEKELAGLNKYYHCHLSAKLQDQYPLFTNKTKSVAILHTQVGETNAAIATTLAINAQRPDLVIKIGCVGGNSVGIHTGDIVVPIAYFHSAAWITRARKNNQPTSDASQWQSVFGEKPYQVNSGNLHGRPYIFYPDLKATKKLTAFLNKTRLTHTTAYIGGGNMWFFDKGFMRHVPRAQIPAKLITQRWVADMESYAIAHACYVHQVPFTGIYRVSNSDYYDEPYLPEKVAKYFSTQFIQTVAPFINNL